MSRDFFLYCLERNTELLTAMLHFNRKEEVCVLPQSLAVLRLLPEVRRRLAVPRPVGFWDFAEEARRLALLEPADVRQAALVFAAAAHAPDLAAEIRGSAVAALRQGLGPELYAFTLQRGRFCLGSVRSLLVERDSHIPLLERIHLHADWSLSTCWADWPQELRERAALCQKPALSSGTLSSAPTFSDAEGIAPLFSPVQRRALWDALKKLLLTEVAPQWAPYFA